MLLISQFYFEGLDLYMKFGSNVTFYETQTHFSLLTKPESISIILEKLNTYQLKMILLILNGLPFYNQTYISVIVVVLIIIW